MSSIIRLGEVAKPIRVHLPGSIRERVIQVLQDGAEYLTTSTSPTVISSGKTSYDGAETVSVTVYFSAEIRISGTTVAYLYLYLFNAAGETVFKSFSTTSTSYVRVSFITRVNGFISWEIALFTNNANYAAYARRLQILVFPEKDGVTIYTDDSEKSTTSTTYVTVASGTVNYPKVQNFRVRVVFYFSTSSAGGNVKINVKDGDNIITSREISVSNTYYVRRSMVFLVNGFTYWEIQLRSTSTSYTTYINQIKINYMYVYYANALTPKDVNVSLMFIKQLFLGPGAYIYIDDDDVKKFYINSKGLDMILEFDPPLPMNKINFPDLDVNVIVDLLVIE